MAKTNRRSKIGLTIEPSAGNGLLDRRIFLKRAIATLSAAGVGAIAM